MSSIKLAQRNISFSGTVDRVLEDGFFLNTGNRSLLVDTYDLYGDFTRRYISVGQRLTVSGEFDDGEFDAFSITLDSNTGGNNNNRNNNRKNVIRGTAGSDDLVGGNRSDRLIGKGGDDDLLGRGGNDTLVGGAGDDDLLGGKGRDILRGGTGQDDLVGGGGRDVLIGNGGRDTFVLEPRGNDIIRDFRDGVDELGLSRGLRFNDLILQQQGNNTLIFADGSRVATLLRVDPSSITPADLD